MSEGLFCRERGGKLPAATAVMAAEGGPGPRDLSFLGSMVLRRNRKPFNHIYI